MLYEGLIDVPGSINGPGCFLLFLCAKSISTSLLNSKRELWLLDHSMVPPGLVIMSCRISCVCAKLVTVVIRIMSSTYAAAASFVPLPF